MIDNPAHVDRLQARITAALPLSALLTPPLITLLQDQKPGRTVPPACVIEEVTYAGDEGGIVCRFLVGPDADDLVLASITHLKFDPRHPLTREIVLYQKRRTKRIRRQG